MDKTALTVASLHAPSDENEYWHGQTPEARLAALELMRQVMYGYDPSTERLQRLLTIALRPYRKPLDSFLTPNFVETR